MVSSPLEEELKHQKQEDRLMQCVARRHLHGLPRLVGAATVDKFSNEEERYEATLGESIFFPGSHDC